MRSLLRTLAALALVVVAVGGGVLVWNVRNRPIREPRTASPDPAREGNAASELPTSSEPVAGLRGEDPSVREAVATALREAPSLSIEDGSGLSVTTRETLRLHFNLGLLAAHDGDTEAALAAFRRVIEANPVSPFAHHARINLGVLLDRAGRTGEAVRILREATRPEERGAGEAEDPVALHHLGVALLHQGAIAASASALERAAALAPQDAEILQNLTVAHAAASDFVRAEAAARRALEVAPDRGVLHENLGMVLWRMGDLPGAADAVAAARARMTAGPQAIEAALHAGRIAYQRGLFDESARGFEEAVSRDPGRVAAHFNLGVARSKSGDGWSAAESFRRVLALAPDDTEAHFNLGVALFQTGDLEGAVAAYRAGLARDGKVAQAQFLAGYLEMRIGRDAAAETHFRMAAALGGPEAPRASVNLGVILERRGDLAGAIDAYRRGDPQDPTTFYNLGLAHRKRNDLVAASDALKRARALAPTDKRIATALGDVEFSAGRLEEAAAIYREALGGDDDGEILLRIGHIERRKGRMEDAERSLTRGIEAARTPRARARLLVERAVLWDEMGRTTEAVRDLIDAGQTDPSHTEVYYNLGILRARIGEDEQAVEDLKTAVRLAPDDPRPSTALGNLYQKRGLLDQAREMFEAAARADSAAVEARWRLSVLSRTDTFASRGRR